MMSKWDYPVVLRREESRVLGPLHALEATLEAELHALESCRPTAANYNDAFRLRETLRQLRQGVPLAEGMDPRLYQLLSSEGMRRFHFRATGLAPWCACAPVCWPSSRRPPSPACPAGAAVSIYGAAVEVQIAGARRNTGDLVQLSEEAAARWADKLEPV
jgi:hypothetical protein